MQAFLHQSTAHAIQVPGAEVKVYRVQDPVRGDDPQYFEDGVLDAEPITEQVVSRVLWEIIPPSLGLHLVMLLIIAFIDCSMQLNVQSAPNFHKIW